MSLNPSGPGIATMIELQIHIYSPVNIIIDSVSLTLVLYKRDGGSIYLFSDFNALDYFTVEGSRKVSEDNIANE